MIEMKTGDMTRDGIVLGLRVEGPGATVEDPVVRLVKDGITRDIQMSRVRK